MTGSDSVLEVAPQGDYEDAHLKSVLHIIVQPCFQRSARWELGTDEEEALYDLLRQRHEHRQRMMGGTP